MIFFLVRIKLMFNHLTSVRRNKHLTAFYIINAELSAGGLKMRKILLPFLEFTGTDTSDCDIEQ